MAASRAQILSSRVLCEEPGRDIGWPTIAKRRNGELWPSYSPRQARLQNGWLLAVYGRRMPPFCEMACIRGDEGVSWEAESEIMRQPGLNHDLGHPESTQMEDGSIWTL